MEPQTDREFLIRLDSQLGNLAQSIDRFSKMLRELEEKKIATLDSRMESLETWRSQIAGGWKIMVVMWTIASAGGVIALIKYFME